MTRFSSAESCSQTMSQSSVPLADRDAHSPSPRTGAASCMTWLRPDLGHPAPPWRPPGYSPSGHGYTGASDPARTPYRGCGKPASQTEADRAHARLRAPGKRANAQLKAWRILHNLRCCPWRAGQLAKAIHVLQPARSQDEKRSQTVQATNR
jgi:hypothetical protein